MNEDTKQLHSGAPTNSVFIIFTLGIFLLLSSFLFAIDFVPEQEVTEANEGVQTSVDDSKENISKPVIASSTLPESTFPTRVLIESIGVDTSVITPASDDIGVLDKALLLGAVYYPESGVLGKNGNVLIFGHSSYLPIVNNKAFKAFNELRKLKPGDTIVVESETHTYTYEAVKVELTSASEARISFDSDVPMLTLATCNSFGKEEERWVVTARLSSKQSL